MRITVGHRCDARAFNGDHEGVTEVEWLYVCVREYKYRSLLQIVVITGVGARDAMQRLRELTGTYGITEGCCRKVERRYIKSLSKSLLRL